uniref:Uncharacterized protein n=1 Tax=Papio anubis TaxID=9555 RepID=A0A8I5NVE4_PAPAN
MALTKMLTVIRTIKSRLRWSEMEMRNLLRTGVMVTCYTLANKLVAFCPHLRDLWNFELERDDLGYLAEEISKWKCIQEEAEHKSLENLQSDCVTEKKKTFSGEKFKPAAEICISNKKSNVNHQHNGENFSEACQRPSWKLLPSQAQRSRRKIWFHRPGLGPPCSAQSWDMLPCIPAASAPVVTKRGQGIAQAIASEGVSPKLWCFHMVLSLWVKRSQELRFGNLCLDFRGCMKMSGCPGRSLLQGQSPYEEPLLGQCIKEVWGRDTQCPTGGQPSETVRRGPPSSRPKNGRSTNSLHCAPGKAADTQCQPMKAARGVYPVKPQWQTWPRNLGAHLLQQHDLDVRHGVKGDHFGTLRFNDCPIGLSTCLGPVAPLFWPMSPICNGCIYPMPVPPLYLGSNKISFDFTDA